KVTPETETLQHARQEMGQVRFVIDDQSLRPGVRSIEWFFMLPTKGSRPHLASDGVMNMEQYISFVGQMPQSAHSHCAFV
ncbi:MAG: hypothetical protein ACJ8AI_02485, partial [Rhodopila sp.]